jgi:hypothetical protein
MTGCGFNMHQDLPEHLNRQKREDKSLYGI